MFGKCIGHIKLLIELLAIGVLLIVFADIFLLLVMAFIPIS